MADIKRDFNADRTLCDAATAGPWKLTNTLLELDEIETVEGTTVVMIGHYETRNARFIAEARTGWPAALEHIRTLEDETRRCDDEIERLRRILDVQVGITSDFLEENERLREERDSHQRLCIREMEKVAALLEGLNEIMDKEMMRYQCDTPAYTIARECIAKLGGDAE